MTEKQLQQAVLDCARLMGWLRYHTHDSRRSHPGFPDLVLVRPPQLLFVELKSAKGKATAAQQAWLDALSQCGPFCRARLWRPEHWHDGTVESTLR